MTKMKQGFEQMSAERKPRFGVKIVSEVFPLPEYKTKGSSGVDLQANTVVDGSDTWYIEPGERGLIKTGIFVVVPMGYEAQIRTRSGLALKKGLIVLNSPGTIDSDYRGEVGVILHNASKSTQKIYHGERIAQMVLAPVMVDGSVGWGGFEEVTKEEFDQLGTERGQGGFGSTGV
jgi:dUTP pyrophosphatase